MKLYEIKDQFRALDSIELDTDDDIQAFADLYAGLQVSLTEKIENCCMVLANAKAQSDAITDERARLDTRRKAIEAKIERLREYMQYEMESIGVDKVDGALFSVRIQNNPQSVEMMLEAEKLPAEYQRVKIEADKAALKKALLDGIEIAGCKLVQTKSLRVK
jgi:hypothetical protein